MGIKISQCKTCGKVVEVLKDAPVPLLCCGDPLEELIPGTSDGAAEKHVPIAEVQDGKVMISVGSVDHPMEETHDIEWIYLCTDKAVHRKELHPGDAPKASFVLGQGEKPEEVYAYCNLHGLWKTDL